MICEDRPTSQIKDKFEYQWRHSNALYVVGPEGSNLHAGNMNRTKFVRFKHYLKTPEIFHQT